MSIPVWTWRDAIRDLPISTPAFAPTHSEICAVCKGPVVTEGVRDFLYTAYGVCSSCAGYIASAYWFARSGECNEMLDPDGFERQQALLPKRERMRPFIEPEVRWEVFERDGYSCKGCGAKGGKGNPLQVDHVAPWSKGGADALENYQTLCRTCNIAKGDRP